MKANDLRGIIPATILPMTADYEPDFGAYQRYLKWILDQAPVALAVNMDTGEGPQLSAAERVRVIEKTRLVVKDRCPVLAGITGGSTLDAVENARQAKRAGAQSLVIFPNAAFRNVPLDPIVARHHHQAIAEATDLPIVLFQLAPIFGGVRYTREVLLELMQIPNVVALKESSFDVDYLAYTKETMVMSGRDAALLTGHDLAIVESFQLGADGALLGFGAVACDMLAEMIRDHHAGRLDDVMASKPKLQGLADFIFHKPMLDYRARCKAALALLGVIELESTYVRPPMLTVPPEEYDPIREALMQAELLPE
jgi:4-hydroxy-tetrahydrodipicolinate synthase